MAYVNTDTQGGSNKRAIDTVEPWRFGKLPKPLWRYGCTAKCAPEPTGPPGGSGARRLPQPIARTTAKWCALMGEAPIGAHRGGVHQAPPMGMASAGMASAETAGMASAPKPPMGEAPIAAHPGVHQAPPTGMAAAPKPPTGMAPAETPAAPIGSASAPTGKEPTGNVSAEGDAALGGRAVSDPLPLSLPEAIAWLRQQAPTQELQLAALDARLCEDYDEYSWRRSGDARAWAMALGVFGDNKKEALELALKFKHYDLRPRVLAAAKALLDQLASEELAHL